MTRYKQTEFSEEDSSSIGGVQLNEPSSSTGMQIRYHTARVRHIQTYLHTYIYIYVHILANKKHLKKLLMNNVFYM